MSREIGGIHHVTAIATDPQANVDFYTGVLGLRLVKKTVNFDDPGTYHFYYGDEEGHPGTILTFFPWPMARTARRGTHGAGQTTATAFSVPAGSLGYWSERLERLGVPAESPRERFSEEVLTFLDPDGMKLELVARTGDGRAPWEGGPIPAEHAIRGFAGVTLTQWNPEVTARLLTGTMGFRPAGEAGDRFRFESGFDSKWGGPGTQVDILASPSAPRGHVAAGTVHHVAFRVADDPAQKEWHELLLGRGQHVSPIMDRQYFHSIYFREPGGVLFELATDPPGFTWDEPVAELGSGLKLPPWLEAERQTIESILPPVHVKDRVKSGEEVVAAGGAA